MSNQRLFNHNQVNILILIKIIMF